MTQAVEWRDGTPAAPGVYAATGFKDELRRQWHPATGFSAPWYFDDPTEIIDRAKRTPADRELVHCIRWRESPVALAAAA